MRNAGMDEAQAGIKIAGRNFNNLRYAGDFANKGPSNQGYGFSSGHVCM